MTSISQNYTIIPPEKKFHPVCASTLEVDMSCLSFDRYIKNVNKTLQGKNKTRSTF